MENVCDIKTAFFSQMAGFDEWQFGVVHYYRQPLKFAEKNKENEKCNPLPRNQVIMAA